MTTVFILYLVLLIGIVIVSARKSKTNRDFVLGGYKLSGYSLALSERATGESAWLLLGLTGHAFAEGMGSIWVAIGCVLGVLIIWFFLAHPLQKFTMQTGALTVTGLFIKKFPKQHKAISVSTSLVIVFFFMLYIASQFAGAGKIFNTTFGLDPFWGMVLGAGLVTVYTMLGGFITVVATDAFQAILMVVTCVVLPVVALLVAAQHSIDLSLMVSMPHMEHSTNVNIWSVLLIVNGLSWAFGYTGQPQLLTRMMALRNSKDTNKGRQVAIVWTFLAYGGAFAIGLIGYQLMKAGALGNVSEKLIADSEQIMPVMVSVLLNPLLAGVLLSGAVSAMMSTASSQLIVTSTAINEDLVESYAQKTAKQKLRLNRVLVLVVGLVAFLLTISMENTVYSMVSYAWSGIGASIGPAVILLLFWKRFSVAGLFGSLAGGTITTIVWKTWLAEPTGLSERFVSYAVAFVCAVMFSLVFPRSKRI